MYTAWFQTSLLLHPINTKWIRDLGALHSLEPYGLGEIAQISDIEETITISLTFTQCKIVNYPIYEFSFAHSVCLLFSRSARLARLIAQLLPCCRGVIQCSLLIACMCSDHLGRGGGLCEGHDAARAPEGWPRAIQEEDGQGQPMPNPAAIGHHRLLGRDCCQLFLIGRSRHWSTPGQAGLSGVTATQLYEKACFVS
jgi:hypothetical protein